MAKTAAQKRLYKAAETWKAAILAEFELEDWHKLILDSAARCWIVAEECRLTLEAEGLQTTDRFGQVRPNGLITSERDARQSFLRHLRELALDVDAPGPIGRPPGANAGRRK